MATSESADDDVTDLAAFLCRMQNRNAKYVRRMDLISASGPLFSSTTTSSTVSVAGAGTGSETGGNGGAGRVESRGKVEQMTQGMGRLRAEGGDQSAFLRAATGKDSDSRKDVDDLSLCASLFMQKDDMTMRLSGQKEHGLDGDGGASRLINARDTPGTAAAEPEGVAPSLELTAGCYDEWNELFFRGSDAERVLLDGTAFKVRKRTEVGERIVVEMVGQPQPDEAQQAQEKDEDSGNHTQNKMEEEVLLLDSTVDHILFVVGHMAHAAKLQCLVTGLADYLIDCEK